MDPSLAVWVVDSNPNVAPGLPALLGERARVDPAGTIYFRIGPLDTDWSLLPGGGGVPSAPSDATYITQTPNATLTNEQALSLLVSGVLQSTTATGVVDSFAVGTGLVPYGLASKLSTDTTFGYNVTNGTLAVGIAPGSANAFTRLHLQAPSQLKARMFLECTGSAVTDFAEMGIINDLGQGSRASVYYTSSTYTGVETFPNSLTFSTASGAASHVVFSPNNTMTLDLLPGIAKLPNSNASSISLALTKAGAQAIEKQGSGSLQIGTLGAEIFSIYTTNATRMSVAAGGNVAINNLTAGGVVYATAATGVLAIGTAAEVAAAITWPASGRVLVSAGVSSAPVGFFGFEYDTGVNAVVLATVPLDIYNLGTRDANTNWERLFVGTSSNTYLFESQQKGTGVVRPISISAATAELGLTSTGGILVTVGSTFAHRNLGALGAGTYEQVRAFWTSNIWVLATETAGGTERDMIIGNATNATVGVTSGTSAYIQGGAAGAPTVGVGSLGVGISAATIRTSSAGATLNAISVVGSTVTVTGSTNITTATGFNYVNVATPTFTGTGGAKSIATASTVTIQGPPTAAGDVTITNGYALLVFGRSECTGNVVVNGSGATLGFFGNLGTTRQTSGANLTNNVTSGGTDDTIADFTSLVVYATDAAAIRNDIYQLARKLKQINDGLRAYNMFT